MADQADPSGGPVRPLVALALATVTFIALLIFALGMTSLLLAEDIVAAPGLGQIPGVFATAATTGGFALALWPGLRGPRPSFWTALWTAATCYAVYVAALWIGVLVASGDLALATAVAGRIATTWFGLVVALAGGLAAWGGVALVRARGGRPRWPWEDEFDE